MAKPSQPAVLVIGATGMLGRPVVRRLIDEEFPVRILARSPTKAKRVLPEACEIVRGDLREADSLTAAMADVRAVYLNLSPPMTRERPAYNVELDGTRAVIATAKQAGVDHVLRISAADVENAADEWWVAADKVAADEAMLSSGIDATVFRPTWFMESLNLFIVGPFMMCTDVPRAKLRWIAGDDYGRMVAEAIRNRECRNRMFHPQGPEPLTMGQAIRRFGRAIEARRIPVPAPRWGARIGGKLSGKANYFDRLIASTIEKLDGPEPKYDEPLLPEAVMRIEDYVAYRRDTGDIPKK